MKEFNLTKTDILAVSEADSEYLNNKGAKLYNEEKYEDAIEYYRLAASMGNIKSISNLGYCYLYGRSVEKNIDLAIAYFKIASTNGDIDATYKLGNIYETDKWNKKDEEMSIYYYSNAMDLLTENYNPDEDNYNNTCMAYPSLCLALGKNLMPNGLLSENLRLAYSLLICAKRGYEIELENGNNLYEASYNETLKLLENKIFNEAKDEFDFED